MEVWLPVVGAESFYAVSNLGRVKALARQLRGVSKAGREFVRNLPERLMRPSLLNSGYLGLKLSPRAGEKAQSFTVHRLVAEAFVPNPMDLPEVNHDDGVKINNAVGNLLWCTRAGNVQHAIATGLWEPTRGSAKGTAKLTEADIPEIRRLIAAGWQNTKIAECFGVSTAPISYIRNGYAWTHVPTA